MCGARAARLASQRSRSAFAAGRQSDSSGKAATTYEIAFMRREDDDVGVLVIDCVVNHDAYVPLHGIRTSSVPFHDTNSKRDSPVRLSAVRRILS